MNAYDPYNASSGLCCGKIAVSSLSASHGIISTTREGRKALLVWMRFHLGIDTRCRREPRLLPLHYTNNMSIRIHWTKSRSNLCTYCSVKCSHLAFSCKFHFFAAQRIRNSKKFKPFKQCVNSFRNSSETFQSKCGAECRLQNKHCTRWHTYHQTLFQIQTANVANRKTAEEVGNKVSWMADLMNRPIRYVLICLLAQDITLH